jgi:serpin B
MGNLIALLVTLAVTALWFGFGSFSQNTVNNPPYSPSKAVASLVTSNAGFAFDLYHSLKAREGNLFYSPYSISTALAMTYAGAKGETQKEMVDVLHFTMPQEELHSGFLELSQALESREGLELSVANSLWGQKNYTFLPEFLKQVEEGYSSPLELVDFVSNPEIPRQQINDWVAQKTKDRIKDLIPQDELTKETRLVLANAIYFNALWQTPFDSAQTKEEPFTLLDGQKKNVPMMFQQNNFGYNKGENFQLVSLPYNGDMSFVAILPDEGEFAEVEAGLSAAFMKEAMSQVHNQDVVLKMPKFEFEVATELVNPMQTLGMKTAFVPYPDGLDCNTTSLPEAANFSGMDGRYCLYISAIFHKAFVKVEEKGTEAAAATAVVMATKQAVVAPPTELTLDRPFIFLIRDNQTDSVLFIGRMLNPIN